jgi:hypothetical protein
MQIVAAGQTTVGLRAARFGRTGFVGLPRRSANGAEAGGKSELRRAVRRVTPGQGNLTE